MSHCLGCLFSKANLVWSVEVESTMKAALTISIGLNLALLGGLSLLLADHHRMATVPRPLAPMSEPTAPAATVSPQASPPETVSQPFRWSDLESSNGYPGFIANLRASGCPEATVDDIVRGDTGRAFNWERNRLGLDGSGNGPWSESRENQVIASLLRKSLANQTAATVADSGKSAQGINAGSSDETASSQNAMPRSPLFLQDANWSALGFSSRQQAAIAQVRQQYQNAMSQQNPNSSGAANQNSTASGQDSASADQNSSQNTGNANSGAGQNTGDANTSEPSQTALQNANDQLRNALGSQGYAAYEQQQYMIWYQQQLAAAGDGPVTLNLPAFLGH
jgi:hypothetical protein